MSKHQTIIGRFEHIDLGDRFLNVPAKIDTGAFRSSIHAQDIKIINKKGKEFLSYTLLGHPVYKDKGEFETRKFETHSIRSSNGHKADRYQISLKIRLGYKVFNTPFTLIDRSENVFPILIGRKVLSGRYLVDTAKASLSRLELLGAKNNMPGNQDEVEGVTI